MLKAGSTWRYLSEIDKNIPLKIREQLGHSLKSSIAHTYVYDTRDNVVIPSTGILFKTTNEYAGFQENAASFSKSEIELQQNLTLFKGVSVQSTVNVCFFAC